MQLVHVGDGADQQMDQTAEQFGVDRAFLEETPFVLIGSIAQIVDKLERLRLDVGISHVVIRSADAFAPVVDALAGR